MSETLPVHVFTSAQVRVLEQEWARGHGGDCYELMLRAGAAAHAQVLAIRARDPQVWIFAGRGNNGGDGLVVAALLLRDGIIPRVFAMGEPREGTEAHQAFRAYQALGGCLEYALPDADCPPPDVVVDALLGTGLHSAPHSPCDDWILFINRTRAATISIDVPSGLNADTGVAHGDCVRADVTVCMLALKPGLLTADGVDYAGRIVFAPLDYEVAGHWGHPEADDALPLMRQRYEDITETLPVRMPSAHKGDAGRVLLIGGAQGMGGAICISALGALRCGAGLVRTATFRDNIPAINARCPEIMTVDFNSHTELTRALEAADVIAVGPGLGLDEHGVWLLDLVRDVDKPVIYDADALTLIARGRSGAARRCVMTPHPAECARLLGITTAEVCADRFAACTALQKRHGGTCLLKGAGSIVCDGRFVIVICEGSPAMASGGMGDLLTGMTAALAAQGMSLRDALIAAACIHGRAGQRAGERRGVIGTLATDLLADVHALVNGHERGGV